MSKISAMPEISGLDGTEYIPVLKDGANQKLEVIKMLDDISFNREDFIGGTFTSSTIFSNVYTVDDTVGGSEDPSEIDVAGDEPSALGIRHNIDQDPETGSKKTYVYGNKIFVPRVLNDFHFYETRLKMTRSGENPAGLLYLGFSNDVSAAGITSAGPFVGFYVSILSAVSGDIPYNQITIAAGVTDDTPTNLLYQILTTPTTCWVETQPMEDAEYTKFGVKLFKDKAEFYLNDVLSHTYTFVGSLFSTTTQELYASVGCYSYGEDYYGGGSLHHFIDYISVKSKLVR